MAVTLTTVAARDKLKARREPYWHKLDSGCYLGFRKMAASSTGSWIARYRNAETEERPKKALGEFAELPPGERFGAAKRAAEEWFTHLGRGGAAKAVTVKAACANYVKHTREAKGEQAASDLQGRFRRWIDDDPIALIDLDKLTRVKVGAWRKALASTRAKVSRDSRDTPLTRPRAPSTVNRDMSALRAALNYAHDMGHVTTDQAWRVALRPIESADGRREVYLDLPQRRKLIDAAPSDVGNFMRALSVVPLRPGALAGLTARHFNAKLGVLAIGKDKAGADRRIKLPQATADWFKGLAKDKLPTAPLLARADGRRWDKDAWKKPIKEAASAAGLSDAVVMYALRHSAITDLVVGGLDLLTVAQLSGTSVAMIERHYGHLREDHAAAALARLAI